MDQHIGNSTYFIRHNSLVVIFILVSSFGRGVNDGSSNPDKTTAERDTVTLLHPTPILSSSPSTALARGTALFLIMTSITPKRPRDADTKAMMTSYIDRLIQGENLSSSDVTAATEAIASGAVDPTQIAAFLVTFRMKVRNEKKDSVLVVV